MTAAESAVRSLLDVVEELCLGLAHGQTPEVEWAEIVADSFQQHRRELLDPELIPSPEAGRERGSLPPGVGSGPVEASREAGPPPGLRRVPGDDPAAPTADDHPTGPGGRPTPGQAA